MVIIESPASITYLMSPTLVLSHSSCLLVFLYNSAFVLLWKVKSGSNDFVVLEQMHSQWEPVVQVLAMHPLATEFHCVLFI